MTNQSLAFGAWPSPITAAKVAAGSVRLAGPRVRNQVVYWSEQRPHEDGRSVIVARQPGGSAVDQLAEPYSARSLVHEYGGGSWWLGHTSIYFVNASDQRLYRLDNGVVIALTPEPPQPRSWRYADGVEYGPGGDHGGVICVRERHEPSGPVVNELVVIPATGGGEPTILDTRPDGRGADGGGVDFVAAPRLSPDGRWLSWLSWSHPNMPWDGTELRVAQFNPTEMTISQPIVVGGGDQESIFNPDWTPDAKLVFATDRSGWWNLHRWDPLTQTGLPITGLEGSEIGGPMWVLDTGRWSPLAGGGYVAAVTTNATDALVVIDPDGTVTPIQSEMVEVVSLAASESGVVVHGASPVEGASITHYGLDGTVLETCRPAEPLGVDRAWLSRGRPIRVRQSQDKVVHAFFYPPTGAGYQGPEADQPPLIVVGHGGPTAHSSPALNLKLQYWTSRGFAVVDVNYGGSTGFGRAYRQLLAGAWGVVDVADCVSVASHLVDEGIVNPNQVAIRGSSAGGLTVLGALASSSVFSAGTSLYGVTDLEALARDTHKFESRYLDRLIGPYPEQRSLYQQRSPINHTDELSCPILVMQGLDDPIVPPSQAEAVVAALAAKQIPHAYVGFPGEQHGFRQEANIIRSLEVELWFYSRVFGFEPADRVSEIPGFWDNMSHLKLG